MITDQEIREKILEEIKEIRSYRKESIEDCREDLGNIQRAQEKQKGLFARAKSVFEEPNFTLKQLESMKNYREQRIGTINEELSFYDTLQKACESQVSIQEIKTMIDDYRSSGRAIDEYGTGDHRGAAERFGSFIPALLEKMVDSELIDVDDADLWSHLCPGNGYHVFDLFKYRCDDFPELRNSELTSRLFERLRAAHSMAYQGHVREQFYKHFGAKNPTSLDESIDDFKGDWMISPAFRRVSEIKGMTEDDVNKLNLQLYSDCKAEIKQEYIARLEKILG